MSSDLRKAVRFAVSALDDGGMGVVPEVIRMLEKSGVEPGKHVGSTDLGVGTDRCVEWYAGQVLSILKNENWFAVNSIVNALDKFCPEREALSNAE